MVDEPSKLDISDEMIAERRGGSGKMPNDMPSWMASSIVNIDKFSKAYKSTELTDELIDIYIDLSKMLLVHGNNKNKRMMHRYE